MLKTSKLVFVVITLIISACSVSLAQQQQAVASAQKGAAEMLKLHLEVGPISMLRMVPWVALSEGLYQKNGLDVDQCHTPATAEQLKTIGIQPPADMKTCPPKARANSASLTSGPAAMPGFLNNALGDPLVLGGGQPTIISQVLNPNERKRVMILTYSNVTNWPIYVRKGITSPEELKGGRIGVLSFTDIHGFMAMAFMEAMGWDPKTDMKMIIESGPKAFKDLDSGYIDAMVANDSASILLMRAGYKPLVNLGDWKIPLVSGSANADVEWLKNNQETARRFVKSQVEARALIERDRSVFDRALVKYFNITDSKIQDLWYSTLHQYPRKPYPPVAGVQKAMKLYDRFYPQLREHRPEEFIDDSFIRELDESGFIDNLYK